MLALVGFQMSVSQAGTHAKSSYIRYNNTLSSIRRSSGTTSLIDLRLMAAAAYLTSRENDYTMQNEKGQTTIVSSEESRKCRLITDREVNISFTVNLPYSDKERKCLKQIGCATQMALNQTGDRVQN